MWARLGVAAVAAAVVLTAFGLRAVGWRERLERPGWARITDPDAAYHLRRAERIRDGFPTLALLDPFLDAPHGAVVPWPPAYDLVLAGVVALAPADPATGGVRTAVAFLPPLLLGLAVLAVFALSRRLDPGRTAPAAVAAAVAALAVADRPWTGFAQLDHSAAELLASAGLLAALARAASRPRVDGAGFDRRAVLPGIVFGLGLCVQAALLPLAALPLLAGALAHGGARRQEQLRSAATFWLAAAAVTAPPALAYAAAGAGLDAPKFGLFHPLALAVAAALAGGLAELASASPGSERPARGRRALGWSLLAAGGVGLVVLAPALGEGFGFLARDSAWVASIAESRSPFAGSLRSGFATWARELSWLVVLLPVGWIALVRRARAGESAAAVASAGLLVAGVLASAQARFVGHLSLLVGVAAVAAARSWLLPPRPVALRLAVAALLLVLPALGPARRPPPPDQPEVALAAAREPLADLRALAAGRAESERGVVLAEWSFGHFVKYFGHHPTVVDNFGDWLGDLDFPRRALLATDDAVSERMLDERRVRFLLVGEVGETLSGLLPTPDDRARFVSGSRLEGGTLAVDFRPEFARTVLFRAARLFGGGALGPSGELVAPLRGLRLVSESAASERLADGREVALYKLFERVPGARLRVTGLPAAAPVRLEAELLTARGTELRYVDAAVAGASGEVEFRFPYATDARGGTRPLAVRISAGDSEVAVREIPERAVRNGEAIALVAVSRAGSRGRG